MDTTRKSATDCDDERKERTSELTRAKERKRVSYEEVHRKTEGSRLELTITGFWDGVENEMQKRAEEDEEGRSIGLRILKD